MNVLERWSPVTDDFAIVNAPINRAVAAYAEWMKRLGHVFTTTPMDGGIDSALASLAPLSVSKTRKLFISAGADWTAFFQNGIDGSDPTAGGYQLSMELDVIGMRVCVTPEDNLWQAVMWEVYAPPRLGGDEFSHRRALAAANDGGRWTFDSLGEPYQFEQLSRYVAPRKCDRFDRQMLYSYLRASAVNPFEAGVLSVSADWPAVRLELPSEQFAADELSYAEAAARNRVR